ncbi:MAG: uracil-DNA glycosylase [Flavobacteriales bacterium]|jgi:uracil-DNA glycosylase|nr:uracil-DNA glycosylase [Flavobacteriales bacterium]
MSDLKPKIEESWLQLMSDEFHSEYFNKLKTFLVEEKKVQTIYPPGSLIFNAFDHTPVSKVKAVILGQDPYHGPGQAHGLCFSVNDGVRFPPSLQNIFKELKTDIGMEIPFSGNLTKWADEGVLLLNATLTVRARNAGSHQGKGWEQFTDAAIKNLSEKREKLVFLLWGRFAQNKEALINPDKGHLILKAPHPSPFSAHNGFFGCRHFSRANAYLEDNGTVPIDWNLNTQ